MTPAQAAAAYKRLVRLLVRAFYGSNVPEKDPDAPPPRTEIQMRKAQQAEMEGLAVVVIDALTQRQWVREDYVPQHENGIRDPIPEGLAQQLRIHPKALRAALRYLEQEQFVWRDHRLHKRRRGGGAAAAAASEDSTAGSAAGVGDAVDEEEAPKGKLTYSYCCIDYARCYDAAQLRLHKLKKALKEQAADRNPVQTYLCPRCGTSYTSLDAIRLLDPVSQNFICEECGTPVQQQFGGGETGDDAARRQRREAKRRLLAQLEQRLQPVTDLMAQLKDVTPPDYGTLDDYFQNQMRLQQRRAAAAERRAGGGGVDARFAEPEVEVELGPADAADAAVAPAREVPVWLTADGVGATPYAAPTLGAAAAASGAAAAAVEVPADVQAAYVTQYLAEVERIRKAAAVAADEKKVDLKDEKWVDAKQPKAEGGWQTLPEEPVGPTSAAAAGAGAAAGVAAGAASAQFDDDLGWEDAGGDGPADAVEADGDGDGFDWEEA